jgi:hypothetical protein
MKAHFHPEGEDSEGYDIILPMTISAPGSIRVACPKGMLGTVVLECSLPEYNLATLAVRSSACEAIHDDICESFGAACGMCGKDAPPADRVGYCDSVKRQGLCSKPKYKMQCEETCCFAA